MSPEKSAYVFKYYAHLMTLTEKSAFRNFFLIEKNQAYTARNPKRSDSHFYKMKYINSPTVLAMMEGGFEAFRDRTVQRILKEHPDEVFFNYCPKCNKLVRTPRAKQCYHCFHSWHDQE